MIYGLQIVGMLFALIMLYLTFLYYKRDSYGGRSFFIWFCVWLFFLLMVMFPETMYSIMETLNIQRTVDFFVIGGFLFFSVLIFYLYVVVKQTQKKVEMVVRKIALEKKSKK